MRYCPILILINYKIRNALKKAAPQTDFAPFETTYAALAAKLEPLVYEYGFLKE